MKLFENEILYLLGNRVIATPAEPYIHCGECIFSEGIYVNYDIFGHIILINFLKVLIVAIKVKFINNLKLINYEFCKNKKGN